MKVFPIRQAKARFSECVKAAQGDRVLITRHGRPVALLNGVEGYDLEQVLLASNPKFWELIEARRGQKALSRAEIERKLTDR